MNSKRVSNNQSCSSNTLPKCRKMNESNGSNDENISQKKHYAHVPRKDLPISQITDSIMSIKSFPRYARVNMSDAIATINWCPIRCELQNHVVHEKSYNTLAVQYKDSSTTVHLEYTFPDGMPIFEGCFSLNEHTKLPLCKIVKRLDKSNILRFKYCGYTRLDVTIQHNSKNDPFDLLNSCEIFNMLPDNMNNVLVSQSLFEIIVARLFPTKAHLIDCLINLQVNECKERFRKSMTCTRPACLLEKIMLPQEPILRCVMRCHLTKLAQPILHDDPFPTGKLETLDNFHEVLQKLYPFFKSSLIRDNKLCVHDVWVGYFGSSALPETVSDTALNNMFEFYVKNNDQYAFLVTRYPSFATHITKKDYQSRKKRLDKWLNRDSTIVDFSDEEIAWFNRFPSNFPRSRRAFILNSNDPDFKDSSIDSGSTVKITCTEALLRKKELGVMPKAYSDYINFLDMEHDPPLPMFELANKIRGMMEERKKKSGLELSRSENLFPHSLQKKLAKYTFSANCENAPTQDDRLAVIYTRRYQEYGFKVPKIPANFFARFQGNDDDINTGDNPMDLSCIICKEARKQFMFPKCLHLCLCEGCSFKTLKCPVCYEDGIARKVFY